MQEQEMKSIFILPMSMIAQQSNPNYKNMTDMPHKLPPQDPLPPYSLIPLPQSIVILHESSEVVTLLVHTPVSQVIVID